MKEQHILDCCCCFTRYNNKVDYVHARHSLGTTKYNQSPHLSASHEVQVQSEVALFQGSLSSTAVDGVNI